MNSKLFIGTLSFFLLFSCDDSSQDNSPTELINLIESNQGKWEASNIGTYIFTYYSPPNDCPTVDPFPAVEITIVNNVITNLYVVELGEILDLGSHSFPTIDDVFENMINSVNDIEGTPSFDDTFGYPVNYETDISDLECDGYSVTISSFI
ncbi:MAG: DUF6174 domain-containing protein [Colwellia sp.]|nr:DUF6174 domain-containing protein [Colwellia sp.]